MTTPRLRPPPWSKRTDQLVRAVAVGCRPAFQAELATWIESRPRFGAFITANQTKVRKKLTAASDAEARLDVRTELLVAYRLLADRRFELAFEAYGAHQPGPDLTVTYRDNQRFNLELTRLRPTDDPARLEPGLAAARLARVVAAKVRQLPADLPNALVLSTTGLPITDDCLRAATRQLKQHTDQKDDAFFVRRGLKDARDFYTYYLRLAGIVIFDEAAAPPAARYAPNRDARLPLPSDALARLLACLTGTAIHHP